MIILALLLLAVSPLKNDSIVFLKDDPRLAGSVVKYCESADKTTCKTIDRSKEKNSDPNFSKNGVLILELSELTKSLQSIDIRFNRNPQNPDILEFKFSTKKKSEKN